jgi:4-methyl-5(b-hydroxyethyl)-thiazole monophosphate biosynthesis
MAKKALLVLADGFEEIEALTPIDILRRAGVEVVVAGLGGKTVKGSRGAVMNADTELESYSGAPDAIVFPGGMPGAENLAKSSKVKELIRSLNAAGKLIAAICASPALVLAPTGLLDGKKATCYPGMEENFSSKITHVKDKVVQDGNIITSRGPATAFPFALKIVENLVGRETAELVGKATLFYE